MYYSKKGSDFMTIYEKIRYRRNQLNMSQQELAEKVGFKTASAINKIELGIRDINQSKIKAFASALNTTTHYLLSEEDNCVIKNEIKSVKIPVLGYVRAGIPLEAVEDIIDYEEISEDMAKTGTYFCLQIKGDSMEPKFSEGDVIVIRQQETVENGDVAVVLINGNDATIKKFYRTEAGVQLVATNPTYPPLFFTPQEVNNLPVSIIGKAVELRAKL